MKKYNSHPSRQGSFQSKHWPGSQSSKSCVGAEVDSMKQPRQGCHAFNTELSHLHLWCTLDACLDTLIEVCCKQLGLKPLSAVMHFNFHWRKTCSLELKSWFTASYTIAVSLPRFVGACPQMLSWGLLLTDFLSIEKWTLA